MGHAYINFVDLMECVTLQPDGNMTNQDNVLALEQAFSALKADSAFSRRVTGILFEEGRGRGQHTDYGAITQWLRKHFPSPQFKIMAHAHGGTGTEHAASL